jgi:hypothetical protein
MFPKEGLVYTAQPLMMMDVLPNVPVLPLYKQLATHQLFDPRAAAVQPQGGRMQRRLH